MIYFCDLTIKIAKMQKNINFYEIRKNYLHILCLVL